MGNPSYILGWYTETLPAALWRDIAMEKPSALRPNKKDGLYHRRGQAQASDAICPMRACGIPRIFDALKMAV